MGVLIGESAVWVTRNHPTASFLLIFVPEVIYIRLLASAEWRVRQTQFIIRVHNYAVHLIAQLGRENCKPKMTLRLLLLFGIIKLAALILIVF